MKKIDNSTVSGIDVYKLLFSGAPVKAFLDDVRGLCYLHLSSSSSSSFQRVFFAIDKGFGFADYRKRLKALLVRGSLRPEFERLSSVQQNAINKFIASRNVSYDDIRRKLSALYSNLGSGHVIVKAFETYAVLQRLQSICDEKKGSSSSPSSFKDEVAVLLSEAESLILNLDSLVDTEQLLFDSETISHYLDSVRDRFHSSPERGEDGSLKL